MSPHKPSRCVYRGPGGSAFISTFDCKMFALQSRPKFWQNEPNAGDSSRMANDLAIRRALEAWAAGRITALPRLEWASPLFFRCIISGRRSQIRPGDAVAELLGVDEGRAPLSARASSTTHAASRSRALSGCPPSEAQEVLLTFWERAPWKACERVAAQSAIGQLSLSSGRRVFLSHGCLQPNLFVLAR